MRLVFTCVLLFISAYSLKTISFVVDSRLVNTVAHEFLSVNIDSASLFSGQPGTGIGAREPLNFENKDLIRFASMLKPGIVRIGGSIADTTMFDFDNFYSNNPSQVPNGVQILINSSYWKSITTFSTETGLPLIFDLDFDTSRTSTNSWNSTNAQSLMDHLAQNPSLRKKVMYGWQLGNEPGHFDIRHPNTGYSVENLVDGFSTLNQMKKSREKLFGPDVCGPEIHICGNVSYLEDFLKLAAPLMDGVTIHSYPIKPCNCQPEAFIDPASLDRSAVLLEEFRVAIQKYAPHSLKVIGETASTATGGCFDLSNSFASGFYWMNQLGLAATSGWDMVFRQDLAGYSGIKTPSNYAMLGQPGWTDGKLVPNPDFYTSVLWKKHMGDRFFNTVSNSTDGKLRMFASCSQENQLQMAFLNMYNESVSVDLSLSEQGRLDVSRRVEYHLSSANSNLTSKKMFLNSVEISPETFSPDIKGIVRTSWEPLIIQPLSYGFISFPDISLYQCINQ